MTQLTSWLSFKTPRLPLQRLIETASWGEDPAAIEQQLVSHQRFHNSIQRSVEVDRAREELVSRRHGDSQSEDGLQLQLLLFVLLIFLFYL